VSDLTIYEADLMLLLRGETVRLDVDVTVTLSAILSLNHVAALVCTELMDEAQRQAMAAAVLPETRRHLAVAVDNERRDDP
jgi:hypothetical protein